MKHRISFYLTYACIVLFGSIGLLLLALGEKSPRESASENRMLAGFPALSAETVLDGSFMDGLESYLSDGMPAREHIVTDTAVLLNAIALSDEDREEAEMYDAIEALTEERDAEEPAPPETAAPEPDAPQEDTIRLETGHSEETTSEPTEAPIEAPTEPTAAPTEPTAAPTEPEKASIPVETCYFLQHRPDGTFRKTYTFPKENMENAIEVLNAYRSVLPEDGHVFFTQVPFAPLARAMQSGQYVHWECGVEEMLDVNTLPGVEVVSTLDVLEAPLLAGEDLYFDTDIHWEARAACYVAQAMLKRIGIDAPDYDAYSYNRNEGFYGSLFGGHPEKKATVPPDTIEVLIPTLPVQGWTIDWNGNERSCPFMVTTRNSYLAYLGGSLGPWRRYETGVDCGRKCLVIGDSYLCCFLPYLAPFYEEIHNTDFRPDYYDRKHIAWTASEYIKEHEIDDIYIVLSTASGVNSSYMLDLMPRYF